MMLQLAAVSLIFFAFGFLAQAMPRHGKQIWGKALAEKAEQRSRLAGSILLLVSFAVLGFGSDISNAILLWLGYGTVSSLSVALLLSYKPHWLKMVLQPGKVLRLRVKQQL